ncbi:DUF1289 domain-containing protein [Halovenus sp. WSH3]|uniref:DUF1289 domain-containing protein n=1 Tax=Halovenus carboxidivorans TaxID=2692199 RepID=A0A6B0T5L6_9EURY|nr:DUF1289 domain-containing protein [Halovenus carboxidivorans]MXR50521.1 DUF1289 domain-containing protein [Halovenus carboxidivorans]
MGVESPCVDVCALDGDICVGCGRTVAEITSWQRLTDAERAQVLEAIADREYPVDAR